MPTNYLIPVAKNDYQFSGINGSPIEISGIFEEDVKINDIDIRIKFFVVPSITMSSIALLGRNFVASPAINVEFGEVVRVSRNAQERDDFDKQIMHIDFDRQSPDEPEYQSECFA